MDPTSLSSVVSEALSNRAQLVVYVIEFLLGLGAGYVLAKGLKYVVAFFVLLLIGNLLNIWSVGGLNLKGLAANVSSGNLTAVEEALKPLVYFAYVLGPIFSSVIILVGFLIGAAIALMR